MLNKTALLATIGLLFWEQSASGQNAAISEILKLETAIHEAELKHDVVALESMLADEYVWTNRRGGLMSKQDYLKSLREGKGLASSPGASSKMENIKVRLVGESVAIVSRMLYLEFTHGQSFETFVRWPSGKEGIREAKTF